ncbi:hypothetical protein H5410_035669 [Solanum commersonii]|uniref:HECT-type E3 ubiquitin transferase n=1 Tax=Solanum commersonii TaxID=4109 RepID=A0A9J5Y2J1_SOLCO|nr:hypothetical protein H5410_035669 [Solanum commersonii]
MKQEFSAYQLSSSFNLLAQRLENTRRTCIRVLEEYTSLILESCLAESEELQKFKALPKRIRLKKLEILVLSGCSKLKTFPEIEEKMNYCIRWDLHPEYPSMKFHLQPIARKTHEQIQLRFGFYALMPLQSFYHRRVVFDRVFFLQLAGEGISLEDIRDADSTLYSSCKQILEMNPETVDQDILSLTFAYDVEELGSIKTVELCPKGKDIVVHS